ncbi:MAG: 16S rRNA (cytosine(1402)-N(4))-methyltransferase RsmH [bacterium]|nr:16S rRNA (cytosine(1402)-N(4))-methyltransferase RsmH [bacterium]
MPHIPVLLKEVIEYLNPASGKIFIDATYGGGGHSKALLEKVGSEGKVLAIDADRGISEIKDKSLIFVRGNFKDLAEIAKSSGLRQVDGILFDLGLSSLELEDAGRGFSFSKDGPLDMRFDQTTGRTAADIVNISSEQELRKIFEDFGEEHLSKRIARVILQERASHKPRTTRELFELIKKAVPASLRMRTGDVARRIFQSLRIAVNGELENLENALPQAFGLLKPGGRIVAISFHSLEDRIVKRYFLKLAKGCTCPPEFPQCICGKKPQARILTRKPVAALKQEVALNSRAKSAKLRAVEKL